MHLPTIPGLEDYSNRTLLTMMNTGILDYRGDNVDHFEVARDCSAKLFAELADRHPTIAAALKSHPIEAVLRRAVWRQHDTAKSIELFWLYSSVGLGWQLKALHHRLENMMAHDFPVTAASVELELQAA